MLSNTAAPKYYSEFRKAVMNGEIPVNKEVSLQMNLIDKLIADPGIWYDDKAVDGWVLFCENELTLTDGSDLKLLPSFKLWGEDVFAWYYFVDKKIYVRNPSGRGGHFETKRIKRRLRNKQILIVARGGAKSMYSSTMHAYYLTCDTSTTRQIATAPTLKQAEEVILPIKTAIVRSRGPLFRWLTNNGVTNARKSGVKDLTVKLTAVKNGVKNYLTNSILETRPMAIDKLQGIQCKLATIDEWLSCDIREDVIGALEQSGSKVEDYLIIATSSEGTIRNGVGDSIKMEMSKILRGEYYNPHVSIWWYKLDNMNEVADQEMWLKAQPNLGVTVSYEAYQLDVERAEQAPAARNDILAKRFGLPLEGFTYFFTYDEIQLHKFREYWRLPCAMGMDASMGDDFYSFVFWFPIAGGTFGVKTLNYITELTLSQLPLAMRIKYEEFIKEDSLRIMPGSVLDPMLIYEDVERYIYQKKYNVVAFGYDPYNAKDFVTRYERENGSLGVEKVIQGARTESVPLGELKNFASTRSIYFDQSIMSYTMGNAITLEDTNGNRKLYKKRYDQKIDCVAAMMDAYVAYKLNRDLF